MEAIETIYNGYRFRSRLEARWAVFFDALGIKYEYEPEGYVLEDGSWYLPDFWLPTFDGGIFAEVKPLGGDFTKAKLLCKLTGKSIWLCEGPPAPVAYYICFKNKINNQVGLVTGVPNADQAVGENRMYVYPEFTQNTGIKGFDDVYGGYHRDSSSGCDDLYDAINEAKQARFEFKETPKR